MENRLETRLERRHFTLELSLKSTTVSIKSVVRIVAFDTPARQIGDQLCGERSTLDTKRSRLTERPIRTDYNCKPSLVAANLPPPRLRSGSPPTTWHPPRRSAQRHRALFPLETSSRCHSSTFAGSASEAVSTCCRHWRAPNPNRANAHTLNRLRHEKRANQCSALFTRAPM